MKTSKILAAAAFSLFAAAGAQAESYQGVHAPVSANNRAEVRAQAVIAARSENPYAEGASSRMASVMTTSTARAMVRTEAVAAARSGNPYADGHGQGVTRMATGTVDRTTVRAQARATAHGDQMRL